MDALIQDRVTRIDQFIHDLLLRPSEGAESELRWADPSGNVVERLSVNGQPVPMPRKRLVTQFRNIYCLSHASLIWPEAFAGRAKPLFDFAVSQAWDKGQGGWYYSLTAEGAPLEPYKDCYGHAFALFACAWYLRADDDSRALAFADRTLDLLETRFHDPVHGGMWTAAEQDWAIRPGVRQQNPHMHALEACLAFVESLRLRGLPGEERPAAAAHAIIDLALTKFIDEEGRLREFFAADWSADPATGHLVEPGHHYEWVWILAQAERLLGRTDVRPVADRLFDWAERHGRTADGHIYDSVDREGRPADAKHRIWPATERLKAMVARNDRLGTLAALDYLLERYQLQHGCWIEHFAADGSIHLHELPGTTGYHIMLALLEARGLLTGNRT
jgi:mannose/cellobiose epimerase-like protein (N-acyl-D-glucosamine 2-epimerase family)